MVRTLIGNLGSPFRADVDESGRVSVPGEGWLLEWWIGADDRWRVPSAEPSVRQRLVEGVPVVETVVHVPGGDAVHRVYGVRDGQSDVIVLEVDNRSPVPVAVAIVIRPAAGTIKRIDLSLDEPGSEGARSAGAAVAVDGHAAVRFLSRPGLAAATCAGADVFDAVRSGDASDELPSAMRCPEGNAQVAYLFPLAHRAVFRAAVPLGGGRRRRSRGWLRWSGRVDSRAPSGGGRAAATPLPPSEAAVRSWRAQLDRGLQLRLPEGRLTEAVDASRAHLLLASGSGRPVPPQVAAALKAYGFEPEASQVRILPARHVPVAAGSPADTLARLAELLESATQTWTWPGNEFGLLSAEVCLLVRDTLIREDDGLELCPALPAPWFGRDLEIHDAPTVAGLVSFAIRWHGSRALLMWDVIRPPQEGGGAATPRISAPALDPGWSTRERSGERLLGPVPEPVTGAGL